MTARWAILIGALVGVLIPRAREALPQGAPLHAVGDGSRPRLGRVLQQRAVLRDRRGHRLGVELAHKPSQEHFNVPIASGLIAGESLIKALLAMLATGIGLASG